MGLGEMLVSLLKFIGFCYNYSYFMVYCNIILFRIKLRLNLFGMLYFMFFVCFVFVWIRMWFFRFFFFFKFFSIVWINKGFFFYNNKGRICRF